MTILINLITGIVKTGWAGKISFYCAELFGKVVLKLKQRGHIDAEFIHGILGKFWDQSPKATIYYYNFMASSHLKRWQKGIVILDKTPRSSILHERLCFDISLSRNKNLSSSKFQLLFISYANKLLENLTILSQICYNRMGKSKGN